MRTTPPAGGREGCAEWSYSCYELVLSLDEHRAEVSMPMCERGTQVDPSPTLVQSRRLHNVWVQIGLVDRQLFAQMCDDCKGLIEKFHAGEESHVEVDGVGAKTSSSFEGKDGSTHALHAVAKLFALCESSSSCAFWQNWPSRSDMKMCVAAGGMLDDDLFERARRYGWCEADRSWF